MMKKLTYEQFYNIMIDAKYADMLVETAIMRFLEDEDYKSRIVEIYLNDLDTTGTLSGGGDYYNMLIIWNRQEGDFVYRRSSRTQLFRKDFIETSLRKLKLRQIHGEV